MIRFDLESILFKNSSCEEINSIPNISTMSLKERARLGGEIRLA